MQSQIRKTHVEEEISEMLNQYLHKELPYVLERKYLKFSIHVHKLHETSTRLEFNHSYWSLLLVNPFISTLL